MKISLCIPMYNESSIIADTARTLSAYMSEHFNEYEILFSDDGSTDGSAELVNSLDLPCVRVVGYEKNQGKGAAVRTAVLEATGDVVMFTDADLAYGTEVISRVAKVFEESPQTDVVIGSRNKGKDGYEGYTALRKLMSKVYIRILGLIGGFKLSDSQCGCKAFRGDAAKAIFSRCKVNGFAFDFESIMWAQKLGYKIAEMPVKIINHRESTVHIIRDSVRMLRDLLKIRKSVNREFKAMNANK